MTCEEKIRELIEAGDKMAALLALSGPPQVDSWEAAKEKVTAPPAPEEHAIVSDPVATPPEQPKQPDKPKAAVKPNHLKTANGSPIEDKL